jgi:hypothetical protein
MVPVGASFAAAAAAAFVQGAMQEASGPLLHRHHLDGKAIVIG